MSDVSVILSIRLSNTTYREEENFVCLICCFMSKVNSRDHVRIVEEKKGCELVGF